MLAGQATPAEQAPEAHLAEQPQEAEHSILPLQALAPQVTLHSPDPHWIGWAQAPEAQLRSQVEALLQ